jgi:hypothetical protein
VDLFVHADQGLFGPEVQGLDVIKADAVGAALLHDGQAPVGHVDVEKGEFGGELEGGLEGDGLDPAGELGAAAPGDDVDVDEGALDGVEAVAGGGVGEALEVLAELLALVGLDEAG